MKTKGQAAMEFLMTYGWAILAAIIVIGVLAIYFRPSTLTTPTFVVTAPFYGVGSTLSSNQAQLEVRNNGGETLTLVSASLSSGGCGAGSWSSPDTIDAGETKIITFSSCTFSGSVSSDVSIMYNRPGSELNLTSTGSLGGSV